MVARYIQLNGAKIAVSASDKMGPQTDPELWPSIGEYPIYDEFIYFMMTNDHTRNDRYLDAIKHTVAGKVVLDIGTGRDFNWARACIDAGATKVYAIEENPESVVEAARKIQKLGLQNKISLVEGNAVNVDLPEKVDVCVSEIIGMYGGSEGVCAVLQDAKQRFMKSDSVMIPSKCTTKIAAASLPESLYKEPQFGKLPFDYVKKVFEYMGHPFDTRLCIVNFPDSCVLSDEGIFEELDFSGHFETDYENEINLKIKRNSRLDGLVLWVQLECRSGGEIIDSLKEQTNWLPIFIPLFYPGIQVKAGDQITATCKTSLSDDGVHPDYQIVGRLITNGEAKMFNYISTHKGEEFRQDSFHQKVFPEFIDT